MQDKIYKAVEIIKGYCAKQIRCENCRFENPNDECMFLIQMSPCDWNQEEWRSREAKL